MPTPPLTVVIADDSALYRQMLLNVLRRIDGVEVVGVAGDGREAIARIRELKPDVVTLDVRMPAMDGIEVLRELRRTGAGSTVIMVSSLTGEGDPATVEALMEGAFDYVLKPIGLEPHLAREAIRSALVEKLRALRESRLPASRPTSAAGPSDRASTGERSGQPAKLPYDAIAIGTSTGGPEALRLLIPRLPRGLPVPLFVVQHMPPMFTATLAARLAEISAVPVVEASDGMRAEPGRVHVAPGGKHMRLALRGGGLVCTIDEAAPRLGCRPSYDNLLESLVEIHGDRAVAVVLTGMGCDGLEGCRRLRAAGGRVIAQSPETCTVYGMPKAVIEHDVAHAVLRLEAIADAVATGVLTSAQPRTSESTSSAT